MYSNQGFLQSDVEEVVSRLGAQAYEFAGRTVLLTGGRGFLGRHFAAVFEHLNREVLDKPARVVLLDNLMVSGKAGEQTENSDGVEFVKHDVTQPFAFDAPLHYVIHAAGIASPFYYRAYPLETLEVAITGTRRMLELAQARGARFVFFSSSEIYGDPDPRHVPMAESYRGNVSCQGPRACYDESKRLGETLCYVYHQKFGTSTNTIRPFNVFGPGMQETDYRVMPNFASRIKGGLPLNIYGSGAQTRTFCYISDALTGFLKVVLGGVPGEAYNIGNPSPEITMLELGQRMSRAIGRELDINIIEYPDSYPADEPMRRSPDIRKARLQLEFSPSVALDEGLERFLRWTEANYSGTQ